MTQKEILEKRIALCQNDIDHYNRNMAEIDERIKSLVKKKDVYRQKISKKQIYIGLLEKDIERLEDDSSKV